MAPKAADIVAVLREVLGHGVRAELHEPIFHGRERDYVRECIDARWVSSIGLYVERFERMLAERCNVARAVAVTNGTVALQVALQLAGVRAGDEVLVPALTFAATAAAVHHCDAMPHFVDVEEVSLGVDAQKLRDYLRLNCANQGDNLVNRSTGRPLRAVIPVHVFGTPADMDPLRNVAEEFGLVVVEDAAEALGSLYKGRPCGSLGKLGVLSFNGNKIVTTGGGGAILTDDCVLADRAKHLTTTAKVPHAWAYVHDEAGYNFRMPNINAALGCAQLEQLDEFIAAKRRLASRYRQAFSDVPHVSVFVPPPYASTNEWLIALVLDRPDAALRERILEACHAAELKCRPAWDPLHRLVPYAGCPRMELDTATALSDRIICLPSGAGLAAER